MAKSFQSTRPVWGATAALFMFSSFPRVSIHAPRVGRDTFRTSSSLL